MEHTGLKDRDKAVLRQEGKGVWVGLLQEW